MLAEHSIALACSCDAIGEDSRVDAGEESFDKRFDNRIEDVEIVDALVEDLVQLEVGLSSVTVGDGEGVIVDLGESSAAGCEIVFAIVERPHPCVDLEGLHVR